MEVFNEFMLADKGHHSLKAWKGEVIDQAIEVRQSGSTWTKDHPREKHKGEVAL